jgi:hypothetical protein
MGSGILVGPRHSEAPIPIGETGPCGGQLLANSHRAVLVMPEGVHASPPPAAPKNQASLVEIVSWRLGEVLPEAALTERSADTPQPARQRGLAVGSVSKVRRHGAPPVYLVSGTRQCEAAIAVVNHNLETVLDQYSWTGICDPVAVMPPSDLDGDAAREFAVFNSEFVAMLRLIETPGSIRVEPMADWTCDSERDAIDDGESP